MALTLVLSVGLDAALLSDRNFALRSAGFYVLPAFSLEEAVEHLRGGDFDLILLCQSIPTTEKERLTHWIRSYGLHIPVVSVSRDPGQCDAFADATVEADLNAVLKEIGKVLIAADLRVE